MKLSQMEPYILGKEFLSKRVNPYRASQADFDRWCQLLGTGIWAPKFLEYCEKDKQFFEREPDFANEVPKAQRSEMFYSLKNGFVSPVCPAKGIFLLKKLYEQYKSPNLIFKQLSSADMKMLFSENFMAPGFTVHDAVCTFCDPRYMPLSVARPKNSLGEFTELYIAATDMVAIVPTKIAALLTNDDVLRIVPEWDGLRIGNDYLKFLGGYNGACNSVYDLRRLI